VTYLDTTILFVAFPDITNSFDDSSTSTQSSVLNAYTIIFTARLCHKLECVSRADPVKLAG